MADHVVLPDEAPSNTLTGTIFLKQERSDEDIPFVLAKFLDSILARLARL